MLGTAAARSSVGACWAWTNGTPGSTSSRPIASPARTAFDEDDLSQGTTADGTQQRLCHRDGSAGSLAEQLAQAAVPTSSGEAVQRLARRPVRIQQAEPVFLGR